MIFGGLIAIEQINEVRDNLEVGDYIEYLKVSTVYGVKDTMVKGHIKAKYPFIFVLEDGTTHKWVDYYMYTNKICSGK